MGFGRRVPAATPGAAREPRGPVSEGCVESGRCHTFSVKGRPNGSAMDTSSFDPTRAVVFDLERGHVSFEGGVPLLLLPAELVAAICGRLEPGVVRQLGVVLGRQAGSRVRARLGHALVPSLELMVEQLSGELSLSGLGAFGVERWGQA